MQVCLPSFEGAVGELQSAIPDTLVLQFCVCWVGSGGMAPTTVDLSFPLTTMCDEGESEVDVRESQVADANAWSPVQ